MNGAATEAFSIFFVTLTGAKEIFLSANSVFPANYAICPLSTGIESPDKFKNMFALQVTWRSKSKGCSTPRELEPTQYFQGRLSCKSDNLLTYNGSRKPLLIDTFCLLATSEQLQRY
jgi:hypothetical protein